MDLTEIRAAADRIAAWVHRTPVLTSRFFDRRHGARLFFKCENFQKTGSFKARGASNAILQIDEETARRGVVTHSSGNHGQALAWAAAQRGIPAWVVMPRTSPAVKRAAVVGYGGEIVLCDPEPAARSRVAAEVQARTGATLVHSHDAFEIIAGQGTAALELIEDVGDLDWLVAPVGGGGLLAGTAVAGASMRLPTRIVGAEPQGADDAFRSFVSGTWVPSVAPRTIADGLLTSLGHNTFAIIRERVHEIVTVSEDAILAALGEVWQRMKIVIEPSSAVAVAALSQLDLTGQRVGVILSGGNVALRLAPDPA